MGLSKKDKEMIESLVKENDTYKAAVKDLQAILDHLMATPIIGRIIKRLISRYAGKLEVE